MDADKVCGVWCVVWLCNGGVANPILVPTWVASLPAPPLLLVGLCGPAPLSILWWWCCCGVFGRALASFRRDGVSWQNVYWRLWGATRALTCSRCHVRFAPARWGRCQSFRLGAGVEGGWHEVRCGAGPAPRVSRTHPQDTPIGHTHWTRTQTTRESTRPCERWGQTQSP
jgi:hypothetical protein